MLRLMEAEIDRENHLRRLNTIYKDSKRAGFENEEEKKNFMALHLRNKEFDSTRRHRLAQEKIDFENNILRNKLIDASIPKNWQTKLKSTSVNSFTDDKN